MIRRFSCRQPIAATLLALAIVGCSDATDPATTGRRPVPRGPSFHDLFYATDLNYSNDGGSVDITDVRFTEIDGQPYTGSSPNHAFDVGLGAYVTLTGKYTIKSKIACDGCLATVYFGWAFGSVPGSTNVVLKVLGDEPLPIEGTF